MPVKKIIYNISEIIGKEVKSGIPKYLIKYSDGTGQVTKWVASYEIPKEKVQKFDSELFNFNALLRGKRLERRTINKLTNKKRSYKTA